MCSCASDSALFATKISKRRWMKQTKSKRFQFVSFDFRTTLDFTMYIAKGKEKKNGAIVLYLWYVLWIHCRSRLPFASKTIFHCFEWVSAVCKYGAFCISLAKHKNDCIQTHKVSAMRPSRFRNEMHRSHIIWLHGVRVIEFWWTWTWIHAGVVHFGGGQWRELPKDRIWCEGGARQSTNMHSCIRTQSNMCFYLG